MVYHAQSEMKRKKAGNYLPLALIAKKANWFYNLFIVTDTNLTTKEERAPNIEKILSNYKKKNIKESVDRT